MSTSKKFVTSSVLVSKFVIIPFAEEIKKPFASYFPVQSLARSTVCLILGCLIDNTGSYMISSNNVLLSNTVMCSTSLVYKLTKYIGIFFKCLMIKVFSCLYTSVSAGSIGKPFLLSIDHELPTTSSTLETTPCGGLNLILSADGDKAIMLPTPQPPILQNKNSFAAYNQSLSADVSVLYSSKRQPSDSSCLP